MFLPGEEEGTKVSEVFEGQNSEIQRLREELRLRSAEAEEYRRNFKKKSEEYEGCVATWIEQNQHKNQQSFVVG